MTKQNDPEFVAAKALAERFGALSLTMLNDTELSPVWRISFLANFFTGPLYAEVLERFGVSRPGFVILFSLSHEEGLVARDICRVTGLPKNSISRAVTELETKGLIARNTDTTDKRAKPLHLTGEGKAMVAEIVPLFAARQAAMLSPLTADEAADLDRLMGKIIAAMPAWVAPD